MKLSLDPGLDTGWACWDSDCLVSCGLGQPPDYVVVTHLAIEKPRIYPTSPVPPNDILTLAIQMGGYVERFSSRGATVIPIEPHAWKGNLPKKVCAERIIRALSTDEQKILAACLTYVRVRSKHHNVLDAVGIGLTVFRGVKI